MLLIEADTGLLNGLVLDLLNFKEWQMETVEAEEFVQSFKKAPINLFV